MTNDSKPTPYPWDELHLKWEREELTAEQVVGQLIIWGEQHEARLLILEREWEGLAHSLADHDTRLQGVECRS